MLLQVLSWKACQLHSIIFLVTFILLLSFVTFIVFIIFIIFIIMLQVKLQHLVTLHVRSSAFGSKLDAGMFMKALSVQYDVWAENHYQRVLSVGFLLRCCYTNCDLLLLPAP